MTPLQCRCGSTSFKIYDIDEGHGSGPTVLCTEVGWLGTFAMLVSFPSSSQPVEKDIERIETDEYVFINNEEA